MNFILIQVHHSSFLFLFCVCLFVCLQDPHQAQNLISAWAIPVQIHQELYWIKFFFLNLVEELTYRDGCFQTGMGSSWFPALTLYLFTWYHHKISYQYEPHQFEFTTGLYAGIGPQMTPPNHVGCIWNSHSVPKDNRLQEVQIRVSNKGGGGLCPWVEPWNFYCERKPAAQRLSLLGAWTTILFFWFLGSLQPYIL